MFTRLRTRPLRALTVFSRSNATVQSTPAALTRPPPPAKPAKTTTPGTSKSRLAPRGASKDENASAEPLSSPVHELGSRGRWKKKSHPVPHPGIRGLSRRKKLLRRQRLRAGVAPKWNRPIAPGVIPAYDEALKVIYGDSFALKSEWRKLKSEIKTKAAQVTTLETSKTPEGVQAVTEAEEELEKMRDKLDILEIQSEVNRPDVRWAVKETKADLKKLSHRYLLEQSWRKAGALDLLMERIYQMNVVPDLAPAVHPSLDLRLTTGLRPKSLHPKAKNPFAVEPGSFLRPKDTWKPPSLYTTVYHTDTRLYTLVLIDPDVPDEANKSFTTFLHWLRPNIPLSNESCERLKDLNDHTTYIPPHPQQGTAYHRYTLLLLPQPALTSYSRNDVSKSQPGVPTSKYLDIPILSEEARLGFDLREFMSKWNLDPAQGGGIHMWREVWDATTSKIYEHVLKKPEPRYGLPVKADPYAVFKGRNKYNL